MEQGQINLLKYALASGAFAVHPSDRELKSKRGSRHFWNSGGFNDGESLTYLAPAYGDAFQSLGLSPQEQRRTTLVGPAYKGIPLATATAMALATRGVNVGVVYDRKEAKTRGEATGAQDIQKTRMFGRPIADGDILVYVDDVITDGKTKEEAHALFDQAAKGLVHKAVLIAMDRQEVGFNGQSASRSFTDATGMPVIAALRAAEAYNFMAENRDALLKEFGDVSLDVIAQLQDTTNSNERAPLEKRLAGLKSAITSLEESRLKAMGNYLRVYGNDEAVATVGKIAPQHIVATERSIVPACDVPTLDAFRDLVAKTHDVEGVSAYKVGAELAMRQGLAPAIAAIGGSGPFYYNHQGGATDIPEFGKNFMDAAKAGGANGIVLSFLSGPETATAWIGEAKRTGLDIVAEAFLPHNGFLASQGGYVDNAALVRMHKHLSEQGVSKFVLPGSTKDTDPTIAATLKECEEFLAGTGATVVRRTDDGKLPDVTEVSAPDVMRHGLPSLVAALREHTQKPFVYDHQKAATYRSSVAKSFVDACADAGVDAMIIFPQGGPETQRAFMYHALNRDLDLLIGGRMTHKAFVQSEGGIITDEGAMRVYETAARSGFNNFVVPGNKTDTIEAIRKKVEAHHVDAAYWAPGFVAQGGKLGDGAKAAGRRFHGIVGRGLYAASDIRAAAIEHTSQLN